MEKRISLPDTSSPTECHDFLHKKRIFLNSTTLSSLKEVKECIQRLEGEICPHFSAKVDFVVLRSRKAVSDTSGKLDRCLVRHTSSAGSSTSSSLNPRVDRLFGHKGCHTHSGSFGTNLEVKAMQMNVNTVEEEDFLRILKGTGLLGVRRGPPVPMNGPSARQRARYLRSIIGRHCQFILVEDCSRKYRFDEKLFGLHGGKEFPRIHCDVSFYDVPFISLGLKRQRYVAREEEMLLPSPEILRRVNERRMAQRKNNKEERFKHCELCSKDVLELDRHARTSEYHRKFVRDPKNYRAIDKLFERLEIEFMTSHRSETPQWHLLNKRTRRKLGLDETDIKSRWNLDVVLREKPLDLEEDEEGESEEETDIAEAKKEHDGMTPMQAPWEDVGRWKTRVGALDGRRLSPLSPAGDEHFSSKGPILSAPGSTPTPGMSSQTEYARSMISVGSDASGMYSICSRKSKPPADSFIRTPSVVPVKASATESKLEGDLIVENGNIFFYDSDEETDECGVFRLLLGDKTGNRHTPRKKRRKVS